MIYILLSREKLIVTQLVKNSTLLYDQKFRYSTNKSLLLAS
jgi:hypothetical protein